MSLILPLVMVLFGAAGLFYWIQSRRRAESTSAEDPLRDRPAGPDGAAARMGRASGRFPAFHRSASGEMPVQRAEARPSGLQGNLGETALHDFLQYLSLGRKAGILELASGRRTGRVVFQGGKVCKASFRGKEGLDAMFLMLDLPEGDFEFHEQSLDETPTQHPLEVVDVLMLWMDRRPKKKQPSR